MGKKRSVGIWVLGSVGIAVGWVILYFITPFFLPLRFAIKSPAFYIYSITGISFVISGFALLQLKKWAPIMLIATALVLTFFFSYCLVTEPRGAVFELKVFVFCWIRLFLLPIFLLIFFFTRPKVKEQFSAKKMADLPKVENEEKR